MRKCYNGSHEKKPNTVSKTTALNRTFYRRATARTAPSLADVNFKTAAFYFHRLRQIIELATADETPFSGEVEMDESCFGGVRKGKCGRGVAGKVPVFGLLSVAARFTPKPLQAQRAKRYWVL